MIHAFIKVHFTICILIFTVPYLLITVKMISLSI